MVSRRIIAINPVYVHLLGLNASGSATWLAKIPSLRIYCRCPLEVCEERDVNGPITAGEDGGNLKEFTGVSSPYEEPEKC